MRGSGGGSGGTKCSSVGGGGAAGPGGRLRARSRSGSDGRGGVGPRRRVVGARRGRIVVRRSRRQSGPSDPRRTRRRRPRAASARARRACRRAGASAPEPGVGLGRTRLCRRCRRGRRTVGDWSRLGCRRSSSAGRRAIRARCPRPATPRRSRRSRSGRVHGSRGPPVRAAPDLIRSPPSWHAPARCRCGTALRRLTPSSRKGHAQVLYWWSKFVLARPAAAAALPADDRGRRARPGARWRDPRQQPPRRRRLVPPAAAGARAASPSSPSASTSPSPGSSGG